MILLLSIFLGSILCLLLCAPYKYYYIFIPSLIFGIFLLIKNRKNIKKSYIIYYFILFLIGYIVCSYIIFMPIKYKLPELNNISNNKKAVIFYCEGEMEKYSPYYANYFFEKANYILKPIYALKIKKIYREIGVNPKINELTKIAQEVRSSLLTYEPYYFYISFSGYYPDIISSIYTSLYDGCNDITIINYTNNNSIEKILPYKLDMDYLNSKGIKINFTQPIYNSAYFVESILLKIKNLPTKYDSILLISNVDDTSNNVKRSLLNIGYKEENILINTNIKASMEYIIKNEYKSVLYINLMDAGSGIKGEYIIPKQFENYSKKVKITGIKSWGYDKNLVKACIREFLNVKN